MTIENIVIQTPYSILPKNKIRIGTTKKFKNSNVLIIAGGVIPQRDYDFLYENGVSEVFGPGTIISESAISILNTLLKV